MPKPGAFRLETDPGPVERRAPHRDQADPAAPPPPPAPLRRPAASAREASCGRCMDRFQKEAGRTRQGVIPIAIAFPAIGPSVFLAAELTPETQAPSLDIQYRKTGGR